MAEWRFGERPESNLPATRTLKQAVACAFPFNYFRLTRLKAGQTIQHVALEYVSALLIAATFGLGAPLTNVFKTFLAYAAFISIYEIGYLMNDYYSVRFDANPRPRGPIVGRSTLVVWIVTRLVSFSIITLLLGEAHSSMWGGFYIALTVIFTVHNLSTRVEIKCVTFSWLAAFRFVAPTLFVVRAELVTMLWLSAWIFYVGFRIPPYLHSKKVLNMPGRNNWSYRIAYFLFTLPLALLLVHQPGGKLVLFLAIYFLSLAFVSGLTPFDVGKTSQAE